MELRELGRSGLRVSPLALGTMNFGADWHGAGALAQAEASDLVSLALDRGVTLFDTADVYGYGAAEEMLGRALKGRRDKALIATKVLGRMRPQDPSSGGLSRRHIEEGLEASLRRLRTDYVDLYMPHDVDPEIPREESLEAFARAQRAGKVRALGCSNFTGPEWRECLAWARRARAPRMEFNESQLSLAYPYTEDDLAPVCRELGASVLAWSPLGGGLLTGKRRAGRRSGRRKDPEKAFPRLMEGRLAGALSLLGKVAELEGVTCSQAALGWLLSKPWLASAIVGARARDQLEETLAARALSPRAAAFIDGAARALREDRTEAPR